MANFSQFLANEQSRLEGLAALAEPLRQPQRDFFTPSEWGQALAYPTAGPSDRRSLSRKPLDTGAPPAISSAASSCSFMSKRAARRSAALAGHLLCALCCLIAPLLWAQNVRVLFQTVSREAVARRLQRLHLKNAERETELKKMFNEAGCSADQVIEEIVRRKDPPNIICTLPGATSSLIIVGAHFDRADEGYGAVDNWSGASLLPSLYQALKDTPRQHTFMFVGFTDEEEGLLGSDFYVKHLAKERLAMVKAMVNLECLGVGPTEVWAHVANKRLLGAFVNVTQSMHVEPRGVNVENVGDDDTRPFRDKKLPVITIHSLTQETWPILHSVRDNLAAVHLDALYESYRIVAAYLALIDQLLD